MTEDGKKVIMAIGGHVGDAELTCGGVLATASLRGSRIVTVAMTGGERGNRRRTPSPKCWEGRQWCSPMWTVSCRSRMR